MASPAVAQPNRVSTPTPIYPTPDADASQSINAAVKRKRESSDDDDGKQLNVPDTSAIDANSDSAERNKTSPEMIQNYYLLLERFDTTPSILKRPMPEPDPTGEPEAKRQKSVENRLPYSIADKVAHGEYANVEAFIVDIKSSITDQLTELRLAKDGDGFSTLESAIAPVLAFQKNAFGLFKRELSYPRPSKDLEVLAALDPANDMQANVNSNIMLTVFGEAPRPRQLYSSLRQPIDSTAGADASSHPLREIDLPNGIRLTKVLPYSFHPPVDKDKKSKTLGELFPAPRNLPSLPPPKAPKSTTKGVQVGWHRPELTEKSKYRAGSYFSQPLSTGSWLNYSNASPTSQTMTKQRERALSLAGNKPSSLELETSELESLFRGAFSSFAPSKDDSAAMVSSGLISHTLWWQKVGQRSFDRLIDVEHADDSTDESDQMKVDPKDEIDEETIQRAIDSWDDSVIDPSLEEACCPQKPDEKKDTDDVLQDVSDMIQTLLSYQKNRNLTLPTATSQSRYANDPAHSDMLTNGTQVLPGKEETATYEALKAQLSLIIQMLPPYAVARLNSDKLEELNISTKIEIRSDEYQGTMEEDEAAARARAAQTAAATTNTRPVSHRSSSSSSSMQYSQQYHQPSNRAPAATPQYYPNQTPIRPPQPAMQRGSQTMPPNYQQRPTPNTGYRPPNAYQNTGYTQQYVKPTSGYSQPSYTSTPTPNRMYSTPNTKYVPGYNNLGHLGNTPSQQTRFQAYNPHPPNTQPTHYTHQSYQPHQQPHSPAPTPSHAPYGHYANGTNPMPPRTATASPHIHHQQPHSPHVPPQAQGYHPAGTPSRQPSYSGPHMASNSPRPYYPPATTHVPPPMQNHQMGNQHHASQPHQTSGTSFQTSLSSHQVQQAMDQAKARFNAQQSVHKPNENHGNPILGQGQTGSSSQGHPGPPVGLGGIGLGANKPVNVGYSQPSPSPQPMTSMPAMNGSPAMPYVTPAANGAIIAPAGKGA
ncbi:hypothetical protein F5B22DRAFT_650604 [Xylaria bambusicola]|uniref:uncharacterized protein n=1 Tax=Xylaria bambusicola TaxID=326684 RepID=UPI00200769CB|nr:uncharacterized protein F5B22DRAFT_650604 [Xylaria bambusicola]KAI0506491.1 hypothetical protein F5B22DRAFT_650604 [Xylaria bambusicola]